jgi:hypothetical protein
VLSSSARPRAIVNKGLAIQPLNLDGNPTPLPLPI